MGIATTDKLYPTTKSKITTINFNLVYENSLSIFFYKILKRQFKSLRTNLYKFLEEKFPQKLSSQSTPYTKMVYRLFSTKKYILSSVNRNIKWTESKSVATIYPS